MIDGRTPAWLAFLERRFRWLEIPNIAIIFVTLQALGFFMVMSNSAWWGYLALFPSSVMAGEYWRMITFLALPLTLNPIFVIFVLWFLYFILNAIETQWGAFKTTLYVLVSIIITIAYSFAFNYPVIHAAHFESTLFLAAAALFPEMEILLFLIVPVKLKWLAWLTLAFLGFEFSQGNWLDRGHLLAIYSNYLLFFGPSYYYLFKQRRRANRYKQNLRE